ncbi:hypothetical protein BDV93DRAFT_564871 [Ceratobasidium sp. AG-I]|nr:hypothetical protein BDV93DRAFT_564871 [Ceratobasidium sp. AG-I]
MPRATILRPQVSRAVGTWIQQCGAQARTASVALAAIWISKLLIRTAHESCQARHGQSEWYEEPQVLHKSLRLTRIALCKSPGSAPLFWFVVHTKLSSNGQKLIARRIIYPGSYSGVPWFVAPGFVLAPNKQRPDINLFVWAAFWASHLHSKGMATFGCQTTRRWFHNKRTAFPNFVWTRLSWNLAAVLAIAPAPKSWALWLARRLILKDDGHCRSRMPPSALSNFSSKSSSNRYTHPLELLSILEPPPEPTSTLSGVVPGAALYDTPSPNLEPQELSEQDLSQRSQRVKTPTEKGSLWSESIKQTHDRSAKIHRTKARKAGRSSTHDTLRSGDDTDGYSTATATDKPTEYLPLLQVPALMPRAGPTSGLSYSPIDLPRPGAASGAPAGRTASTRTARAPPASPTPVPGTPGEDPKLPKSFDATNRTTTESEYTYILESLDPELLTLAVERIVEYDCSNIDPKDLEAMLRAHLQDCAPPVESPDQQAQVVMLSQSPTNLDSGHHRDRLQTARPQASQSAKRSSPRSKAKRSKRQRVIIDTNNPDLELESPPSSTSTETEPETEPETSFQPANLSRSPSPYPFHDTSIDPFAPGWIDFPNNLRETLGTTQPSTQASQSTLLSIRSPRARDLAPRPTSSFSLGQPPRVDSQSRESLPSVPSQPSSSKLPPPNHPPRSGKLPPLQRAPPPGTDLDSLRRSARHKVQSRRSRSQRREEPPPQTAGPSRPRAPHAEALRNKQSLLLRHFAKDVRAAREIHRWQEVATAAGLPIDDIEPGESERENLAQDLLADNEEERAAAVAEEAGELPTCRRRCKPSTRDLFGYERQVIAPAKIRLLAHTLREGPFQTHLPHVTPRAASETIRQIMVNALATGHGRFKDSMRPLVQYKLGLIKPAFTDEEINHNLKLFKQIHPNTFHCMRFSPPYGHYESNIVTQAIAVTLFGSSNAIGVEHHEMFSPMPLTTTAFILAIVQFCIEEYQTGQFRARDLNMSDMLNKYVAHLRGLKEARAGAKRRITELQKHWFDYGYEYSGAMLPDEVYQQPITLRSDIRPDTPQTESENGDE